MSEPVAFDPEPILAGLTGFQRDTVEHVSERFYGPKASTRFLVADETGLGKTMVARGVIARAIEHLERDDSVDRIDIVYICSNSDIARQNLGKLNVTGRDAHAVATRLTLLGKGSLALDSPQSQRRKPVNLISFTPGTSFESGWRSGKVEERAMLFLLLEDRLGLHGGWERRSAGRILQGSVASIERFFDAVERLRWEIDGSVESRVKSAFLASARSARLLHRFRSLADVIGRRTSLTPSEIDTANQIVSEMRSVLARESVLLLEPDLVILDEFQRFRDLLDPDTPAGDLAHSLFNHEDACRVLLLSATPYKPFSYAEEADGGDDHHSNFMQTVEFLAQPRGDCLSQRIAEGLRNYRESVTSGEPVADTLTTLRSDLLQVMTRTERPAHVGRTMLREDSSPATQITPDDLLGFVSLSELAAMVQAPLSVDYWKSAPYFANFMDGYKIANQVADAYNNPATRDAIAEILQRTQHLDFDAIRSFQPIDMGNARMRRLTADTVDKGWWQLLWMPPTIPYLQPAGPFAANSIRGMTKRLIFSSWTATPTAVAALLSYETERRINSIADARDSTSEGRADSTSRLTYRLDNGRAARMSTLTLFWPMPGFAELADVRALRRGSSEPLNSSVVVADIATALEGMISPTRMKAGRGGEGAYWIDALAHASSLPVGLERDSIIAAMAGAAGEDEDEAVEENKGLVVHVEEALAAAQRQSSAPVADDLASTLAELAAFSPANIAYRAVRSACADDSSVTSAGLWRAAATLAAGLRTLFARPESMLLLDNLMPERPPYWRAVLQYCAWGDLQAVLDEYLYHLAIADGHMAGSDEQLMGLATRAVTALSIRPAQYQVFDPAEPEEKKRLPARFALRYGGRKQEQESVRQPQVKEAFNSPFWPFVLATTSVGQEGVDFHWWCHALMHWNTPANPVDFEQREGRVGRYSGHAVRKNISAKHGFAALAHEAENPWSAAYALAEDLKHELGDFTPHWVYPGEAAIERHVAPLPLSRDVQRLEHIKRAVALYRLTFGQPRQEDMMQLLAARFDNTADVAVDEVRLNLRPPERR